MINHDEYEKIVNNILLPLSKELLESNNNKLYHAIKLKKDFDEALLKTINKYITFLKNNAVATSTIDRHKISACLAYAVIKYSPFSVSKKGYNIENLFYANELLGIYSAISLLESFVPKLKVAFPKIRYQSHDIDPYLKTLCASIHISRNNRHLKNDILYFANILFLWETLCSKENKSS